MASSLLKPRLSRATSTGSLASLESALATFRISSPASTSGRRNASHQAQGRANGAQDGPGKRLGAKKSGGQYVVPGNILYKQRGTLWFPGENCYMGRDHTIHAGQPGYVTYYRDPKRHPDRKYIGIVFERNQTLPVPPHEPRRRKLGMLAYQMPKARIEEEQESLLDTPESAALSESAPATPADPATTLPLPLPLKPIPNNKASRDVTILRGPRGAQHEVLLHFRPGQYLYRESNWEIGRAAERSKAALAVKPFVPGDRFAAWRKRTARRTKAAERRALSRSVAGKKGKGKGKKVGGVSAKRK